MKKKAIILGASGAIGNSLLFLLLENKDFTEVLVPVRKELRIEHPKLKQLLVDFDNIGHYAPQITGDVVFCCLGTTKSKTPDQQRYRMIDYQYPLDIAGIAVKNGAESFHLISSIGADKNSSVFYTRTKGEVENDLQAIPFRSIHIYRPSLLDASRKDKRFMEAGINLLMHLVNPLLMGRLKKYRSIKVENVAKAMLRLSLDHQPGTFIHESDEIQKLSEGYSL
jgi:uncharacterized protein YbjT (DUF2867 family)